MLNNAVFSLKNEKKIKTETALQFLFILMLDNVSRHLDRLPPIPDLYREQ